MNGLSKLFGIPFPKLMVWLLGVDLIYPCICESLDSDLVLVIL